MVDRLSVQQQIILRLVKQRVRQLIRTSFEKYVSFISVAVHDFINLRITQSFYVSLNRVYIIVYLC